MDANAWTAQKAHTPPGTHRELPALIPTCVDSFHEARGLWSRHDILVVLADMQSIHCRYPEHLDSREHLQKTSYLTEYARLRFSVSRTLAKHLLAAILEAESPGDITLEKEPAGGIRVAGDRSVYICISYADDLLALGFARAKIGIDIEHIRPLALRHIASLVGTAGGGGAETTQDCTAFMQHWTAMEAYAKYSNMPLWKLLQHPESGNEGYKQSFMLPGGVVLSLAAEMPCPPDRLQCVRMVEK